MKRGLFFAVAVAMAVATTTSQATPVATLVSTQAWVEAGVVPPVQDTGFFKIRFEVTAVDGDVHLHRALHTGMEITSGVASPPPASVFLWALDHSSSDSSTESYKILSGQRRKFDLVAIVTPNTDSVYACQLNRLPWSAEASGQLAWLNLEPPFRSSSIFLHGTPEPCSLALLGVAAPVLLRRRH